MSSKTVLLIDDDKGLSKLIEYLLKPQDYKLITAYTGEEGFQKAKEQPDLILLDRTLPDVDGIEICRRIRDTKELRRMPIIILSARNEPVERIEGLKVGADDYVTKPFDSQELVARIESVLRRSRFSQQAKEDIENLQVELNEILQKEKITPYFQPIFSTKTFEPLGLTVDCRGPFNSSFYNAESLNWTAVGLGMYTDVQTLCWKKAISKWKDSKRLGRLILHCAPEFIEKNLSNGKALFNEEDIKSDNIMLELSETIAIKSYDVFSKKINEYKESGIKIIINDVGGGLAHLDTVLNLKPDYIKIDRNLVNGVHIDSLKRNIIQSIIKFCNENDIQSIAEGISNAEDYKTIFELNVDAVQGDLLAQPSEEIDDELFVNKA